MLLSLISWRDTGGPIGENEGTPLDNEENDMADEAFIGLGCGLPV